MNKISFRFYKDQPRRGKSLIDMSHDYREDHLIQKSAAEFMEKELGWTSVYAFDKETLGAEGTLGHV